jgi:hypothetical protein
MVRVSSHRYISNARLGGRHTWHLDIVVVTSGQHCIKHLSVVVDCEFKAVCKLPTMTECYKKPVESDSISSDSSTTRLWFYGGCVMEWMQGGASAQA